MSTATLSPRQTRTTPSSKNTMALPVNLIIVVGIAAFLMIGIFMLVGGVALYAFASSGKAQPNVQNETTSNTVSSKNTLEGRTSEDLQVSHTLYWLDFEVKAKGKVPNEPMAVFLTIPGKEKPLEYRMSRNGSSVLETYYVASFGNGMMKPGRYTLTIRTRDRILHHEEFTLSKEDFEKSKILPK